MRLDTPFHKLFEILYSKTEPVNRIDRFFIFEIINKLITSLRVVDFHL